MIIPARVGAGRHQGEEWLDDMLHDEDEVKDFGVILRIRNGDER
jgi:hypothetical protein